MTPIRGLLKAILLVVLCASTSSAAVTRVEILERSVLPAYPSYERIVGKIHFAVDPKLPANHIIVDLKRAPRNSQGLVEFSSDLLMLKPIDPARANGTVLLEVPNRGMKVMLGVFDIGSVADPRTAQDMGDTLLFDQGYTLVWVGWEWDVPNRPGLIRMDAPRVPGVTGWIRAQIIVDEATNHASLGDRWQVPYLPIDPQSARMTWQDDFLATPNIVPRDQWHFTPDGGSAELDSGFVPGRIYNVIYKSRDPVVCGLGPAAIRDYISYLKRKGAAERAIGFGQSQSGRFLRTFVYQGFNADERGARVFDGIWAHVAGAGGGSFNFRFAQPSRDGQPRGNRFYPNDLFPFTDLPQTDSGLTRGLLDRAIAEHVVPKIFYTNGAFEYWGRAASLIHTTDDGQHDFAPGPESRTYFLAGTQHAPAVRPLVHNTQSPSNPMDYRWALRALLVAMEAWIKSGTAPPKSEVPLIAKHQLVPYSKVAFPNIPGVELPKEPYIDYHLDFGPDFLTKGIIDFEPPHIGAAFPILLPQVDADGNETSGVRMPDLIVPLATYTGWNRRARAIGASDVGYNMVGSFLPFPRTRAQREKSGDPRLSIEERYASREDYLRKVHAAAEEMVHARLLLGGDVPKVIDQASQRWGSLMDPAVGK